MIAFRDSDRRTSFARIGVASLMTAFIACSDNAGPAVAGPTPACVQITQACIAIDGGSSGVARDCIELAADPSTSATACFVQTATCLQACRPDVSTPDGASDAADVSDAADASDGTQDASDGMQDAGDEGDAAHDSDGMPDASSGMQDASDATDASDGMADASGLTDA